MTTHKHASVMHKNVVAKYDGLQHVVPAVHFLVLFPTAAESDQQRRQQPQLAACVV